MGNLVMNRLDYARIKKSIIDLKQSRAISPEELEKLNGELNAAQIVDPEKVPVDVVTMNSIVRISFSNSGKVLQFKIVYPDEADLKENKISIFSPVATALLGYRVGDEVEWIVPGGATKILIEEIIYQPEAAGHFNL
ncbi:MAG: nucleoside diphosphate kinase regulator [Sporocytophaga sp.]|uniref:nucleoside diphosphate kinase regulator n=1 Tax=Sporocytophaga sp. TaxID=2231183 RepID=UPI001AFD61A1|nr:nucleoside diphosphate kinase regulator [Sporocytophaga sp.]MBO9698654.1 nucleoside diphosphate kinase regulator [Sporocytophaga sp.]